MGNRQHSCDICGRQYKNLKSLRTHKYSYHSQRNSKRQEEPHFESMNSEYDYEKMKKFQHPTEFQDAEDSASDHLQDKFIDMEIDAVQMRVDLDMLQSSVDELEKLVWSMKTEIAQKENGVPYTPKNLCTTSSQEFSELRSLVESNRDDVRELEDRIDHAIDRTDEKDVTSETDEDDHELEARDLLDDMTEIMGFFSGKEVNKIVNDIPKLRSVIKLILKTIETDKLSEEEIKLLVQISTASKSAAKALVHDNFNHLVRMFQELEADVEKLFEPAVDDEIYISDQESVSNTEQEESNVEESDDEDPATKTEFVESRNEEEDEDSDSLDSIQSDQSDANSISDDSSTSESDIEDSLPQI